MSTLKLLYVEDEPDIMEVATLSLELDPGIEVKSADCGEAALALLADETWRPDVILLDVMMPDMDGPTTLGLIRQRADLAETPVIFVTARAQNEDRTRLMGLGARGVITKPFDPLSLDQDVRALLRGA